MLIHLLIPRGLGDALSPRPIPFQARTERDLFEALEIIYRAGLEEFRKYDLPDIYDGWCHYEREEPGSVEEFQSPLCTFARKKGDCEDLSAYKRAWLVSKREDPFARYSVIKRGSLYHIRVKRGDGSIEDPSKRLGMGGENDV